MFQEAAIAAKTEEQSATRQFLSRVFPDVVIDNKKVNLLLTFFFCKKILLNILNNFILHLYCLHFYIFQSQENWLEYFADTIKKQLASQQANTESQNNDEVLAELEKQNIQLQTMVTNYKTIIADTVCFYLLLCLSQLLHPIMLV